MLMLTRDDIEALALLCDDPKLLDVMKPGEWGRRDERDPDIQHLATGFVIAMTGPHGRWCVSTRKYRLSRGFYKRPSTAVGKLLEIGAHRR